MHTNAPVISSLQKKKGKKKEKERRRIKNAELGQ
jgi:hypothetical protein